MSLLPKELTDCRHDGIVAARATALAGLMIGCLLFIL
jgi:hypothetical protein